MSPFGAPFRGYGVIRAMRNAGLALLATTGLAWAEEVTIAALGDSLTQGFGLPPAEGFVPTLQTWLDANGADVTLINAGVSGDTTAGGLARVGWTLTPEVDAMIVALGGNDILRGLDPAAARDNLAGILSAANDAGVEVLLVGIEAPSNYGASYKEAFDGMFPALATEYGTLLYPSFLGPLAAEVDRATALAAYMQPDAIHPNAAGVDLMVEGIGPSVLDLIARVEPE